MPAGRTACNERGKIINHRIIIIVVLGTMIVVVLVATSAYGCWLPACCLLDGWLVALASGAVLLCWLPEI